MPDSQYFSLSLVDSTNETGNFSVTVSPVTALSLPGLLTATTNLEEAVGGITFNKFTKKLLTAFDNTYTPALDTDANNQKEAKWLVRYHGATSGKKFVLRIPTAKLSLLPIVNGVRSEYLNLAADPGLAFKTAFEACAKSPDNPAEAVILDSVQYVAKN